MNILINSCIKKTESDFRILMFAPGFAPFANPEAIVNSKLALTFLSAGWEIDVISRNLAEESRYNYGSSWIKPWLPLKEITYVVEYKTEGKINRLIDTLWSGLRMGHPIEGCRWAAHATDFALSLHKRNPYNVILSRAMPCYAHLPAMKMANKTGLPWVANWNDPWGFLVKPPVKGSLKNNIGIFPSRFCRKVGINASWHTFPTKSMGTVMSNYMSCNVPAKNSTIPHVSIPFNFTSKEKKNDIFKICYTGHITMDRNPFPFLEGFSKFIKMNKLHDKIKFVIVGIDDIGLGKIASSLGIKRNLRFMGKKSYYETINIAKTCDILLSIDPPVGQDLLLTAKFVDYVQIGRPILAITKKSSNTEKMIKNHGGGVAVDHHSNEIAQTLNKLYINWKKETLDSNYVTDKLNNLFSSMGVIDSYKKIFKQIKTPSLFL